MLVSIVIPCYNSGNYLEDAVASVMNQTHNDWEIIIVDDGSTDADTLTTLHILELRQDSRIRVLRQDNAGPAAARNTAIAHAKGKYILPLDADDTIEPSYMAQAIPVLERDSNIGIVYCKAKKFGLEQGIWALPPFSYEEMAIDNVIFCTAFFRRNDWEVVGGFPETLIHGMEDYAFWLKILAMHRKVHQIDDVLFNYRIKARSRTSDFHENKEQIFSTYAEIFRDNIEYFARYAEAIYRYRFHLEAKIPKNRIKTIMARLLKHSPLIYGKTRSIYAIIKINLKNRGI